MSECCKCDCENPAQLVNSPERCAICGRVIPDEKLKRILAEVKQNE